MFYLFCMFALIFLIVVITLLCFAIRYWGSTYYKSTKRSFFSLNLDTGAFGEYLCYLQLKSYERDGAKFLFNCYLPKESDETTEIDVMMIYKSGIYVLESKNYSGWIFGSENRKNWTQSLPNGRRSIKNHFYNPIMQNRTHIKWLRKQVGAVVPLHSLVVFSERCELKDITVNSGDVQVIKRDWLLHTVGEISRSVGERLSEQQIEELYNKLFPYTQVSKEVKAQHVERIRGTGAKPESMPESASEAEQSAESESVSETMPCPVCGGTLVIKTVTEGPSAGHRYFGCSDPDCTCVMAIPTQDN